jgi:hypothetical protein
MMLLEANRSLALTRRHASRVDCHAGLVWVTREGDPDDLFVRAGESVCLGRGLMLVTAIEPARLSLVPQHRRGTANVRTLLAMLTRRGWPSPFRKRAACRA